MLTRGWCPEHAHIGHRAVWTLEGHRHQLWNPSKRPVQWPASSWLVGGFKLCDVFSPSCLVNLSWLCLEGMLKPPELTGTTGWQRPWALWNRTVLICRPRLGIARVQKLAVLQSFDDKQMIATCEALVAGDWHRLFLHKKVFNILSMSTNSGLQHLSPRAERLRFLQQRLADRGNIPNNL